MTLPYPETAGGSGDPSELVLRYLDGYRAVVLRKLEGLSDAQLRTSVLPSGWTPIELVRHLAAMERRWVEWGFLGVPFEEPYPDRDLVAHRWSVPTDVGVDEVRILLEENAARTRRAVDGVPLNTPSAVGGQFASAPTPTLVAVLFHVFQEYARHAGQLDVVRELIDGSTGE